ncbi:2-oxoglutarate and iron-dependent oxygenase domain-containing protein [Novosphingobium sp. MMS21-SN21R]|uniref:isopenicillin N synthase family dioxygenase n=1 Tax=Novosphingobium sp. MMS21-SN21R TaxID=2969298 RepID=UPI0028861215|nr:2-oxoglutarate and iron-dependent oxygenase domain-containing protein [Novosphingobium sp. MMS21-SN21R]MDT0508501.1 2-oxoglutarate and iron-dependent oxygenase domain-containing protein [Novosphingobium sp. MMS21-SN21R]
MPDPHVLPIVDISRLCSERLEDRVAVARELDRACADAGFLYIKGAQLDRALFDRLLTRAKAYFALPVETKMARYIGLSENHSGYVPVGEEQFASGSDDLKEAYDIGFDYRSTEGRRPLLGPNIWPDMPAFKSDVQAYYSHVTCIGRQLFRSFALALDLEENHFDALTDTPPSQLRLIHYPFDASARDRPGIGSHTDYECFTLLFATAPGLQIVDKHGEWQDVPLIDGTLIMNIGDMMEIMSNGRYVATRHRVKKVAQERYSFALFHACNYDHVVEPVVPGERPRYAPIKGGEHLYNQTAQTFAYLKQRIATGALALTDAVPLDSFGPRTT